MPDAPIIIWDLETKKSLNVFEGLKKGVKWIKFSHDDKFIAAISYDNVFAIWSMKDYSVVYNKVFLKEVEFCKGRFSNV